MWTRAYTYAGVVHLAYLAGLLVFLALQPLLRESGGVLFVGFVALSCLYGILTARPVLIPSLFVFTSVGVVYIIFSYADLLPDAWAHVYLPDLILRQAFYVVLLYPLVLCAASLWAYAEGHRKTGLIFASIIVCTLALAPLVSIALGDEGSGVEAIASMLSRGFGNARLLLYMALTYFLIVRIRSWGTTAVVALFATSSILVLILVGVTEPQLQNMVGLGAVLVVALFRFRRGVLVAVVGAFLVSYVVMIPFAPMVYEMDANSGFRLVLSRDAVIGLVQTHGVGIGFGKEVVTGRYRDDGIERLFAQSDDERLALQGGHNSLIQEGLRLGIVGGASLFWLVVVTCFPPRSGSPRIRRHLAIVYVLLVLSVTSNVAVESPTYLVGTAFAIGYLLVNKGALGEFGRGRHVRVEHSETCNLR